MLFQARLPVSRRVRAVAAQLGHPGRRRDRRTSECRRYGRERRTATAPTAPPGTAEVHRVSQVVWLDAMTLRRGVENSTPRSELTQGDPLKSGESDRHSGCCGTDHD